MDIDVEVALIIPRISTLIHKNRHVSFSNAIFLNHEKEVTSMAKRNSKQTSRKIARKASRILRDGRYSKNSKSVAGSALSQTKPKRK